MLRKYKRSLNTEFRRLYRHVVFGGVLVLLVSIIIFQILKNQRDLIIEEGNISVVRDLSIALMLRDETLPTSLNASHPSWPALSELVPVNESEILSILNTGQLVIDNSGDIIDFRGHDTAFFGELLKKEINFNNIYTKFLKSPSLSNELKIEILNSTCCLVLSEYQHVPNNEVAHVFVSGQGYGFLWSLDQNKTLFIRLNYDMYYEFFLMMSIVFVAILIMLVIVLRELLLLDRRLTSNGVSLSNGSGVLKELTYSVDPMSSHIQRLLKIQREMINAISHELRTPIARLRFGLEVVKDEVLDADLMTISALEDDIEELNSLVDEVLTYGKLEEGSLSLHFEKVNMQRLIDGILDHNSLLLSHLSITVDCMECDDFGLIVMADVHHLHRALQNLILNAGKYAHSKIYIYFIQQTDSWRIDIEDDGPGIKKEDREKVFIPFHRLDNSRTRASGGYGLGLAIVQRIAFWHGGSVTVSEAKNGGAKFSFVWSRSYHKKVSTELID